MIYNLKVLSPEKEGNVFEVKKQENETCLGLSFGHFPSLEVKGVDNWVYPCIDTIETISTLIISSSVDILVFDDVHLMKKNEKNLNSIISLVKGVSKKAFFITKGDKNLSFLLSKEKTIKI